MRVKTTLAVLGIGLAGAFTLVPNAPAAQPSTPVVVTNTAPVPVTGTVNLGGSITSTITGTPNVTVANTNPIPVSQVVNRRPLFFASLAFPSSSNSDIVPTYPTGYTRLVIDKVSYQIFTVAGNLAYPSVTVLGPGPTFASVYVELLTVPVPQHSPVNPDGTTNGPGESVFQGETTGLGTVVDSGNSLNADGGSQEVSCLFYFFGHFEP